MCFILPPFLMVFSVNGLYRASSVVWTTAQPAVLPGNVGFLQIAALPLRRNSLR